MSINIDDEIRVLNSAKYEKQRMNRQNEEFAKLPKGIYVTYVGKLSYYSHRGQSQFAKRNPYAFYKDKPFLITNKVDISYFTKLSKRNNNFEVTIAKVEDLVVKPIIPVEEFVEDETAFDDQKAKVEAIEKQLAEAKKAEKIAKMSEGKKAKAKEKARKKQERIAEAEAEARAEAEIEEAEGVEE